MKVAIEAMRSRLEETAGGLRIVIPSRGSWLVVVFLTVWLCGWFFGELFAVRTLLGFTSGRPMPHGPPQLFLVVWLAGWTVGGVAALYAWVWNAAGREIVDLDGASLSISREPIQFPPRKEFDWNSVRNLRVSPIVRSRRDFTQLIGLGIVSFDYGARTFRFGTGLDEAEGAMLIEAIQRRFPVRT